jgi:hypothetical protein
VGLAAKFFPVDSNQFNLCFNLNLKMNPKSYFHLIITDLLTSWDERRPGAVSWTVGEVGTLLETLRLRQWLLTAGRDETGRIGFLRRLLVASASRKFGLSLLDASPLLQLLFGWMGLSGRRPWEDESRRGESRRGEELPLVPFGRHGQHCCGHEQRRDQRQLHVAMYLEMGLVLVVAMCCFPFGLIRWSDEDD